MDELAVDDLAVRASIQLSYAALDPHARRALRLLALLGPRDIPACVVPQLLDLAEPLADAITNRLVHANLLDPIGAVTGEPHYRMHDLLRSFGMERVLVEETRDAREAVLRRIVATALGATKLADQFVLRSSLSPPPPGPEPAVAVPGEIRRWVLRDPQAWLNDEQRNLVTACRFAAARGWLDIAIGLAARLHAHLWNDGHLDELSKVHTAVHTVAARSGDKRMLAWTVFMTARTASLRGELSIAARGFRETKARAARLGMTQLYAYALASLSFYLADGRDGDDATVRYGTLAARLFRRIGDERGEIEALRVTALALNRPDQVERALATLDGALTRQLRPADSLLEALLLNARAGILCSARRYTEACIDCQQCIHHLRKLGERSVRSYAHSQLGYIHLALGHPRDALREFAEALDLGVEIGDHMLIACMERNIALDLCRQGLHHHAVRVISAGVQTLRELGDSARTALTLRLLASIHHAVGEHADAEAADAQAERLGSPADALTNERLRLLRTLMADSGPPPQAVTTWGGVRQ
jgi:tetratricopeptide (TPR) repeat protein